jgi:hypothetical protein
MSQFTPHPNSDNGVALLLSLEVGPCTCVDYELCGEDEDAGCAWCRAIDKYWPCAADPDADYPEQVRP